MIFMQRILSERAKEMQKYVFLYFIVYENEFKKFRHIDLLELLGNLEIFKKDRKKNIRIINNL